jgi:hypothetical protein
MQKKKHFHHTDESKHYVKNYNTKRDEAQQY